MLKRVLITCHDPRKSNSAGEYVSVGNGQYGFTTKYVPYGIPWHVNQMVINQFKERKCLVHYTHKDPVTRKESMKTRLINRYTVQELAPLSQDELERIAKKQAADPKDD